MHSNKVLYPSELEEAALRNGKELDALLLTLQSSAGSDKKLSESSGGHRRNGMLWNDLVATIFIAFNH